MAVLCTITTRFNSRGLGEPGLTAMVRVKLGFIPEGILWRKAAQDF